MLIVLNSEGKDGWLSEFQFGQTSRFQVTSLLVDYRDPLGSLIPILKTYVKQKTATEYVFQHVYEGPSGPAGTCEAFDRQNHTPVSTKHTHEEHTTAHVAHAQYLSQSRSVLQLSSLTTCVIRTCVLLVCFLSFCSHRAHSAMAQFELVVV